MEKKVNITYACPIPWESMKAISDKERLCSKCAKKVRDFSKDETIDTQELECATFRTDQVNNITRTFNIGKSEVLALSLISFLGLAPIQINAQVNSTDSLQTKLDNSLRPFQFSGTIKDSLSGKILPFVDILLKDHDQNIISKTYSDTNGNFEIDINDTTVDISNITVEVRYRGYNSQIIQIDELEQSCTTIDFKLKVSESHLIINGMAIRDVRTLPSNSKIFYEEDIKGAYRR